MNITFDYAQHRYFTTLKIHNQYLTVMSINHTNFTDKPHFGLSVKAVDKGRGECSSPHITMMERKINVTAPIDFELCS